MIYVELPWLFTKRFRGLAIFPFVFLKNKNLRNDQTFINHEKIHLKQQKELLWIFFFLWYFIEFLIHYIIQKNMIKAYYNISFEKEAYKNENNTDYLKQRKFWAFLNYL